MDGARGQNLRRVEPLVAMTNRHSNRSFGRAVVSLLESMGVRRVFFSPGARSTPIVAALADSSLEYVSHYDERGMAFAALGCAMGSGYPSVCVTTSGSAVANLLPACVEASQSNVPLIFLTADRPAELRGSGANQTIIQPGIFGQYVRHALDMPCPEDAVGEPIGLIRKAFNAATGSRPGPVHLNLQFREPLLGNDQGVWGDSVAPAVEETPRLVALPSGWDDFYRSSRGIVVLGRLNVGEQQKVGVMLELAEKLRWTVFADALSGARHWPDVVRYLDWLLRRKDLPKPEKVLQFGGSLVSKRLGEWISDSCGGGDWIQVRSVDESWDPWGANPIVHHTDIGRFCAQATVGNDPMVSDVQWRPMWLNADITVARLLDEELDHRNGLSEPVIARLVGRRGRVVFLGNSMPVRDFDSSDSVDRDGCRIVFANRGASGIDGNIATIAGIARGCGEPVVALLGDLAVLHDVNSLSLIRDLPVTLVVVNNDGGGIFQFLPIPVEPMHREHFWETPHGMDFLNAAAQFGIPYHRVESSAHLDDLLAESTGSARFIECRTDRSGNYRLHEAIAAKVAVLPLVWTS